MIEEVIKLPEYKLNESDQQTRSQGKTNQPKNSDMGKKLKVKAKL